MLKNLLRSMAVVIGVVLCVAFTGPASQAATTTTVTLATTLGGTPKGQAKATIKITWTSATTVTLTGTITDVCPADGAGAYLVLDGVTSASMNNAIGPITFVKDTDGCGNGSVSFTNYKVPNYGYKIRSVWLTLQERDANVACDNSGCEVGTTRSNPYS
ncbi:hypothetical protein [Nocardioides marmorisolisilvae]|uniref:hypothetical protein n=1 Tax=Nocardioides marmorisolisilvae TaxID=1542737 RepID=UPI0011CE6AC8|nr:hypothetical protein [Nocardioides marmorisolisilvae]